MDDLIARLREASLPVTFEMAMEGYVQDAHAVALHAEAADRIEALEAERNVWKMNARDGLEALRHERETVSRVIIERDEARALVAERDATIERLLGALRRACNDGWSDGEGAMAHYLADTEEADRG